MAENSRVVLKPKNALVYYYNTPPITLTQLFVYKKILYNNNFVFTNLCSSAQQGDKKLTYQKNQQTLKNIKIAIFINAKNGNITTGKFYDRI